MGVGQFEFWPIVSRTIKFKLPLNLMVEKIDEKWPSDNIEARRSAPQPVLQTA